MKRDLPSKLRLSVTFVPDAVKGLTELTEATGLSTTDVINRAVQIYSFIQNELDEGNEFLIRKSNGNLEKIEGL